ncbi:MAG: type VI secretion system contractile sheath large subunit [Desulfobacterales bacterium]|nr:type VI secretion system contractile sheath large subunit [Desulfobacterales bacterium]
MREPISFEKLDVKLVSTMEEISDAPKPETPFRILILGDFSGRENRGLSETRATITSQRILSIDRDNFDETLSKIGVKLHLGIAGDEGPFVDLCFNELDDFHPDRIFQQVEIFKSLRQVRKNLDDHRTVTSAAAQVKSWAVEPTVEPVIGSGRQETMGDLLDQVIESSQGKPADKKPASSSDDIDDWDAFLGEIVRPYIVSTAELKQTEELKAAVDAAAGKLMQKILHHPDFQATEAVWRALYFLVSRLETDTKLKLYILDISKAESACDLNMPVDIRSTGIYKLLVEKTIEIPDGEPWAVLTGHYTFDQTLEDVKLLGRIAAVAEAVGAPFLAAAHERVLGCKSLLETPDPDNWRQPPDNEDDRAWKALRRLQEASYIGLALPRFLLRLPYGEATDPIEYFEFEEMPDRPKHENYLWGNPAFACVYLLAQAFTAYGWKFRPGAVQDIEGLPIHIYRENGQSRLQPCTEVIFSEKAVTAILDRGIMPLVAIGNRDTIRLVRFQSLADPLSPLSGRWLHHS